MNSSEISFSTLWPLATPPSERVDKFPVALGAFGSGSRLRALRQRRRDRQPEPHEQRERLSRNREIALEPFNLAGQAIEPSRKRRFTAIVRIGRQRTRQPPLR